MEEKEKIDEKTESMEINLTARESKRKGQGPGPSEGNVAAESNATLQRRRGESDEEVGTASENESRQNADASPRPDGANVHSVSRDLGGRERQELLKRRVEETRRNLQAARMAEGGLLLRLRNRIVAIFQAIVATFVLFWNTLFSLPSGRPPPNAHFGQGNNIRGFRPGPRGGGSGGSSGAPQIPMCGGCGC